MEGVGSSKKFIFVFLAVLVLFSLSFASAARVGVSSSNHLNFIQKFFSELGSKFTGKVIDAGTSNTITFPGGYWSSWKNRDVPSGTGDWEILSDFGDICGGYNVTGIQCETTNGVSIFNTHQNAVCNTNEGFYCLNSQNPSGCLNYQVRFYCSPVGSQISINSFGTYKLVSGDVFSVGGVSGKVAVKNDSKVYFDTNSSDSFSLGASGSKIVSSSENSKVGVSIKVLSTSLNSAEVSFNPVNNITSTNNENKSSSKVLSCDASLCTLQVYQGSSINGFSIGYIGPNAVQLKYSGESSVMLHVGNTYNFSSGMQVKVQSIIPVGDNNAAVPFVILSYKGNVENNSLKKVSLPQGGHTNVEVGDKTYLVLASLIYTNSAGIPQVKFVINNVNYPAMSIGDSLSLSGNSVLKVQNILPTVYVGGPSLVAFTISQGSSPSPSENKTFVEPYYNNLPLCGDNLTIQKFCNIKGYTNGTQGSTWSGGACSLYNGSWVTGYKAIVNAICFNSKLAVANNNLTNSSISSPGTYIIPLKAAFNINGVNGTIDIIWALSGDTTPRVEFFGPNAGYLDLHSGESGRLSGSVIGQQDRYMLRVKVNSVSLSRNNFNLSTASVTFQAINESFNSSSGNSTSSTSNSSAPSNSSTGSNSVSCNSGCLSNGKCLPLGYRENGTYCSVNGSFSLQAAAGIGCENNFECSSNICVNNQCVSGSLIQRILDWFKSFFG